MEPAPHTAFALLPSPIRLPLSHGRELSWIDQAIDEMQAVGVTTVAARASAPQRKSRLRNRLPATSSDTDARVSNSGSTADQDIEGVDRRGICEDILMGGHVQTFVDFFYLTHRPGPTTGMCGTNPRKTRQVLTSDRKKNALSRGQELIPSSGLD